MPFSELFHHVISTMSYLLTNNRSVAFLICGLQVKTSLKSSIREQFLHQQAFPSVVSVKDSHVNNYS